MSTIVQALYDYFLACPLLEGADIGVDWLGEGGYSLSFTPAAQVLRRYTDGGTVRQAAFVLAGREPYGPETGLNLETSGFYEQLAAWMEQQTAKGQLPV